MFVTSGVAIGHLAEYEAGDTARIESRGNERTGRILTCVVLEPTQHAELWDALVSKFEKLPWGDVLEVLPHESAAAPMRTDPREPRCGGRPRRRFRFRKFQFWANGATDGAVIAELRGMLRSTPPRSTPQPRPVSARTTGLQK